MSTAPTPPPSPAGARSGWLVARSDGIVVAADREFAALVGAPDPDALIGRSWPSLVTARTAHRLQEAERAAAAGERWSGTLELLFADRPVELLFEVLVTSGTDEIVLLQATEPMPSRAAWTAAADAAQPADTADLRTIVVAMEALAELRDVSAAARAVLQAVQPRLPFDWGALLLLDGDSAEVLCTYPSAMAGIERGHSWSGLDAADRLTLGSGEPSLSGDLAVERGDVSPLTRLPAFGIRSALRVPLYGGGRVRGCVALYSHRRGAFTLTDGVRLERVVRALGPRLGEASRAADGAPGTEQAARPEPPAAPDEPPAAPDELVSRTAHELNNPLTAILGYAQMLHTLDGDEQRRAISTIEQEALRASLIVRNLLPPQRAATEPSPPAEAPALAGRGERVLIVDDEEPIRMLIREVLGAAGYEVDTAASGEEALTRLEQDRYDLVVADVRMPGIDGVELYRLIGRRWPELQRRLIFITGDPESVRTVSHLEDTDVPCLEKPFTVEQLRHAVRTLLDER